MSLLLFLIGIYCANSQDNQAYADPNVIQCQDGLLTCQNGEACTVECNDNTQCSDNAIIAGRKATDVTVNCQSEYSCNGNTVIFCGTGLCSIKCAFRSSCENMVVLTNQNGQFSCTPFNNCGSIKNWLLIQDTNIASDSYYNTYQPYYYGYQSQPYYNQYNPINPSPDTENRKQQPGPGNEGGGAGSGANNFIGNRDGGNAYQPQQYYDQYIPINPSPDTENRNQQPGPGNEGGGAGSGANNFIDNRDGRNAYMPELYYNQYIPAPVNPSPDIDGNNGKQAPDNNVGVIDGRDGREGRGGRGGNGYRSNYSPIRYGSPRPYGSGGHGFGPYTRYGRGYRFGYRGIYHGGHGSSYHGYGGYGNYGYYGPGYGGKYGYRPGYNYGGAGPYGLYGHGTDK